MKNDAEISEALKKGIYKKNIYYTYEPGANANEYEFSRAVGGTPGAVFWQIVQTYYKAGIQMQVSKTVSDDLLDCDFKDAHIENIPWMAPAIELYFEDPYLPTILVGKITPTELAKLFPHIDITLKAPEYISAAMQSGQGIESSVQTLQLRPEMYKDFLEEGKVAPMVDTGIFSLAATSLDNRMMSYMLHLALKVFAFASIERYKPTLLTRKQMIFGGKPGVHNRPEKKSVRVHYLPKIVYQRNKNAEPSGETREFHGRRRHIRWYHSDRYVNKKGHWDLIEPIADPKTGKFPEPKQKFVVRKPTE